MTIIATGTARVPAAYRLDLAPTTVLDLVTTPSCPHGWCAEDHRTPDSEVLHQSLRAEVPGTDPAGGPTDPVTAGVFVERCDDDNPAVAEPSVPTRVVLVVTEGAESGFPGDHGTQAWTGTPEQAEALAAELLRAARLVRAAGGPR